VDRQGVHEPLGTREADPQAPARAVPIAQRQLEVLDAGTVVLEGDTDATSLAVCQFVAEYPTPARVAEDVSGQLAGGRDHLGLVDDAEAQLDRRGADARPHRDERGLRFDRADSVRT